jgi:hypothetical protein
MKCRAVAVRTGARCKNEAVGDTGACEIESHIRQVGDAAAVTDPELPVPSWDSLEREREREAAAAPAAPAAAPAAADPELAALLRELPPVQETTAAEIAETTAGEPIVREQLERTVRQVLPGAGLLEDEADPRDVDQAAADRADLEGAARRELNAAVRSRTTWEPKRVEFYLRVLVNPRFVKDGKDPLSADELREGSEIAAEILNDLFGERPSNPYLALLGWSAMVVGSRYAESMLAWVAGRVRSIRGLPAAAAAAAPPTPSPAPSPAPVAAPSSSLAGVGFGAPEQH